MGPDERHHQEPEQGSDQCNDKSDLSSLLFKDSSEISTTQQDSAYSSQGTSTYSLLAANKQPTGLHSRTATSSTGRVSFRSFKKLSSKSSQNSGNSNSAALAPPKAVNEANALNNHENYDNSDRTFRKKKKSGSGSQPTVDEPQGSFPNDNEKKALQVATLSQALGFVDQFRKFHALKIDKANRGPDESEINDLATNLLEASQGASVPSTCEFPESLDKQEGISDETFTDSQKKKEGDGFCVAVSLSDGMVMHTTSSLTTVLGYPKDMWVGRSFIDFVHPEDRGTFITQVTENINLPLRNMVETGKSYDKKELQTKSGSFFCRIRIYNGLKSGFSIKERKTRYDPFKLSVCFSEVDKDSSSTSNKNDVAPQSIYLFITAIPIRSAYSEPFEEGPVKLGTGQTGFISKHTAECKFSMFDEFSISYLGYLPQDITGDDIFKYIHPEDLMIIKDSFEVIMVEQGKPFKSKPVRFKIKNGGYITISSWWSSFINPWSRQLEFVHGKHTVMQGPKFPDIFSEGATLDEQISDKVYKQGEFIISEIKCTLKKTLLTNRMTNAISNQSTKNKKELSSFMGSLLEEVAKAENHKFGRPNKAIVISNISPHYSDSSETPPSYNQLTYNENLTRFFNSQPKTLSEKETLQASGGKPKTASQQFQQDSYEGKGVQGTSDAKDKQKRAKSTNRSGDGERSVNDSGSGEQGQTVSGSGEGNGNNSSTLQIGLSAGQNQQGGDDGMLSQDGTGSGSGSRLGSGSRGSDGYIPPPLTEEHIAVHNKDMEKRMLNKFKEAKRTGEMRFLKDSVKQKLAQVAESKKNILSKNEELQIRNEKKITKSYKPDQQSHDPNYKSNQVNMDTGMDQPRHFSEAPFGNYNIAHNTTMNTGTMRQVYSGQNHMPFPGGLIQNPMPQGLHGFTNQFIGVPTVYIPIQGPNPQTMAQGIMLQGRGARYVPLGMMYSPMETVAEEKGLSSKAGQTSGMQPELPNCLAVNSCMVVGQNPPKFARPLSRATSTKGEPGSALESNASIKNKGLGTNASQAQNNGNESEPTAFSTSSSSLYSFLKTSDDFQSQPSSGEEEKEKKKKPLKGEPPVLSEPFWNQRVKMTSDLIFNYQMANQHLEDVLLKDQEALANMQQPEIVDDQLKELFTELEDGVELEEFLVDFECPPTDDDTETSENEHSGIELEEKIFKNRRKKAHLEKMNIFMEAEAPFPMPDSPRLCVHKKENSQLYGSPYYSESTLHSISGGSEKGSQNSEDSFKTGKKQPKTFRFGDTSSLGKGSFDKSNGETSHDEDTTENQVIKLGKKKNVSTTTEFTEETKSEIEAEEKQDAQI
eukprot:TRINITY_DN23529_c0_g1_i1.p1 TRINITY_DN23529_c0_g1~~TRINITY_DN23529_c0_g1_i1.p1  ORF type:complete len:1323 (-),score=302.40 TRINITY_DN23529_c0_g1_i1:347-4315(-)